MVYVYIIYPHLYLFYELIDIHVKIFLAYVSKAVSHHGCYYYCLFFVCVCVWLLYDIITFPGKGDP